MPERIESCYDCDGLNISYRFLRKDDDLTIYEATCRDCGASWEDDSDDSV